jgi:hypothetical protein
MADICGVPKTAIAASLKLDGSHRGAGVWWVLCSAVLSGCSFFIMGAVVQFPLW